MDYLMMVFGTGILALLFALWKYWLVYKQDKGNEKMQSIGHYISEGAWAFLRAEYKILLWYVIIVAVLLVIAASFSKGAASPIVAFSFVIGSVCSALAGLMGMSVATKANYRTTEAARISLSKAFKVAFNGGIVMGMCVVGLGILGLSSLYILFTTLLTGYEITLVLDILSGFAMGASSISLFARVGGGIYTKAADVGADLVGKVEAGIPEDHPLNPATIADNVGDNVGDVSGMGADLFESYVISILSAMILGASYTSVFIGNQLDKMQGMSAVILPMVLAGLGVVSSIVGTFFVRVGKKGKIQEALNIGQWVSSIIMIFFSYYAITTILPKEWSIVVASEKVPTVFTAMGAFWAVFTGLIAGMLVGMITEYYTATGKKPVLAIVEKATTGAATAIIEGLAVGMRSTGPTIVLLVATILLSYHFAGLYGIGLAALGMLMNTGIQMATDAYGPISDNAGGIAEMSELPAQVRERTDMLDAVGNTTAAIGKGFASTSAAVTALALLSAYMKLSGIDSINVGLPKVMAGLLLGGMLPFVFSAMAMGAVSRAAMSMVEEVRRQFKQIPALKKALVVLQKFNGDTSKIKGANLAIMQAANGKADYAKCVEISTQAALREMMLPGLLAIISPVIVGVALGTEALGGLLAGVTVCGVLMAISQANTGGAWDNAKKTIEKGITIKGVKLFKGSDAHKASVVGDTVGDPLKDTSGPSTNILIKVVSVVAVVIAPMIK